MAISLRGRNSVDPTGVLRVNALVSSTGLSDAERELNKALTDLRVTPKEATRKAPVLKVMAKLKVFTQPTPICRVFFIRVCTTVLLEILSKHRAESAGPVTAGAVARTPLEDNQVKTVK